MTASCRRGFADVDEPMSAVLRSNHTSRQRMKRELSDDTADSNAWSTRRRRRPLRVDDLGEVLADRVAGGLVQPWSSDHAGLSTTPSNWPAI
jgi:hypothetical protein